MQSKYKNPAEIYEAFNFNCLNIFLDKSDFNNESGQKAISFCQLHGYSFNENKATALYFLRGRLSKVNYEKVLVGICEVETLPPELYEIIHCLTFWNQEGEKFYDMNKEGQETYSEFILKCIACDCRVFVEAYCDQFITGIGGNHVWVDDRKTHERILIIHF